VKSSAADPEGPGDDETRISRSKSCRVRSVDGDRAGVRFLSGASSPSLLAGLLPVLFLTPAAIIDTAVLVPGAGEAGSTAGGWAGGWAGKVGTGKRKLLSRITQ